VVQSKTGASIKTFLTYGNKRWLTVYYTYHDYYPIYALAYMICYMWCAYFITKLHKISSFSSVILKCTVMPYIDISVEEKLSFDDWIQFFFVIWHLIHCPKLLQLLLQQHNLMHYAKFNKWKKILQFLNLIFPLSNTYFSLPQVSCR